MSMDARWFAAYVRSRHESTVAAHLAVRQVECFLPQYRSERQWKDRKIELMLPLFPQYLFVRIPIEDRLRVLETPGVVHMVGAVFPEAIEDAEIERLKAGLNEVHKPRPHAYIRIGERVVVTRGPLEGYTGFLVREKTRSRVVMALDLVQRAMSVEVDVDAIAPEGYSGVQKQWPAQSGKVI